MGRVATEAAWLKGNNLEKRRNKEEERRNAKKRLTLTGLLMQGLSRDLPVVANFVSAIPSWLHPDRIGVGPP
jgi:hypothetical protein